MPPKKTSDSSASAKKRAVTKAKPAAVKAAAGTTTPAVSAPAAATPAAVAPARSSAAADDAAVIARVARAIAKADPRSAVRADQITDETAVPMDGLYATLARAALAAAR